METKEKMMRQNIEPTKENIQRVLDKIADYAKSRKLAVDGPLEAPGKLTFKSKGQQKALVRYLTKLDRRVKMGDANTFLWLLNKCTKVGLFGKPSAATRLRASEEELGIQAARKEWKAAKAKEQELLAKYKEAKGDFYK